MVLPDHLAVSIQNLFILFNFLLLKPHYTKHVGCKTHRFCLLNILFCWFLSHIVMESHSEGLHSHIALQGMESPFLQFFAASIPVFLHEIFIFAVTPSCVLVRLYSNWPVILTAGCPGVRRKFQVSGVAGVQSAMSISLGSQFPMGTWVVKLLRDER